MLTFKNYFNLLKSLTTSENKVKKDPQDLPETRTIQKEKPKDDPINKHNKTYCEQMKSSLS